MASDYANTLASIKAFVMSIPYDDDCSDTENIASDSVPGDTSRDTECHSNSKDDNIVGYSRYHISVGDKSDSKDDGSRLAADGTMSWTDGTKSDDNDDDDDDDDGKASDASSADFVQALAEMPTQWDTTTEDEHEPSSSATTISRPNSSKPKNQDGEDADDADATSSTVSPFLSGPFTPHKFEIRPVGVQKGLGMVATRHIAVNEVICSEVPLLICPEGARSAHEMQSFMLAAMAPLSEADRDFVIHGLTNASGQVDDMENHLAGVYRTNAWPCSGPDGGGRGKRFGAIFKSLAMANHSCVPNAKYRWVEEGEEEMDVPKVLGKFEEYKKKKKEVAPATVAVTGDGNQSSDIKSGSRNPSATAVSSKESCEQSTSSNSTPSSRASEQTPSSNSQPGNRSIKHNKPRTAGHGTFIAIEPIFPGTEITISYIPRAPYSTRQSQLHAAFGFYCSCPLCSLPAGDRREDEDVRAAEIEGLELTLFSEPPARLAMRARDNLQKFETLLDLYEQSEGNREPDRLRACAAVVRLCVAAWVELSLGGNEVQTKGFERAVSEVKRVCGFEEGIARLVCEEAVEEME